MTEEREAHLGWVGGTQLEGLDHLGKTGFLLRNRLARLGRRDRAPSFLLLLLLLL